MRMRLGLKAAYAVFFLAVAGLAWYGREYYLAPAAKRVRLPLHALLRQSGSVGHFLGILGALFMVLLLLYSLRKRLRILWTLGNPNDWLEVHIFLGIAGPVLVLFHTDFRFSGLVGISFWSMVLVVASGIVGRYIYQSIPRSVSGMELSRIELEAEEIGLTYELRKRLPREHPFWPVLARAERTIQAGPRRFPGRSRGERRLRTSLARSLKETRAVSAGERRKLLKLLHQRQKLIRRSQLLDRSQKVLYYWHLFHVPFVILMFLILLVHIYVSVRMGNTWIL